MFEEFDLVSFGLRSARIFFRSDAAKEIIPKDDKASGKRIAFLFVSKKILFFVTETVKNFYLRRHK